VEAVGAAVVAGAAVGVVAVGAVVLRLGPRRWEAMKNFRA
jgi:hypothetical protein